MSNAFFICAEVVEWAKNYTGPRFHALLSDMPYHLESITERFGGENAVPPIVGDGSGVYARASKGFMGQEWDGGDLAFRKETWEAFHNVLFPGAFGIAFSASRNWHRMAVAIEDAGFIIHPTLFCWATAQGFPKVTNPQKILAKRGHEQADNFAGYSYGRQALKPAIEPIIVFQKPHANPGAQIDGILQNGAGLFWIDGTKIAGKAWKWGTQTDIRGGGFGNKRPSDGHVLARDVQDGEKGRWPSNFILIHNPGCQIVGWKDEAYQINTFDEGAKPFGDAVGDEFSTRDVSTMVPVWECVEGCPAPKLDKQSGILKRGTRGEVGNKSLSEKRIFGLDKRPPGTPTVSYGDKGGASRFFFQAGWSDEIREGLFAADPVIYEGKASPKEKHAGIKGEKGNFHPTIKPLALTRYLAKLLLPPDIFAPRRLFVPCSGTGSEVIGGIQAGWDEVTGIEIGQPYVDLSEQRVEYWQKQGVQREMF